MNDQEYINDRRTLAHNRNHWLTQAKRYEYLKNVAATKADECSNLISVSLEEQKQAMILHSMTLLPPKTKHNKPNRTSRKNKKQSQITALTKALKNLSPAEINKLINGLK